MGCCHGGGYNCCYGILVYPDVRGYKMTGKQYTPKDKIIEGISQKMYLDALDVVEQIEGEGVWDRLTVELCRELGAGLGVMNAMRKLARKR